ncbi:MAG: MMPL family transporter, partial [Pseudomonadales bacterium]
MTPANTAIVRTLLGLCQQYAVLVLVTCTCLGIGGIALFMTQGKLNTDLGTLIQPDDDLKWYQSNEAFKERFPMYQQTALVVIRGPDANATQAAARALKEAFTQHALVKSVFAPTIDAFIDDHRLYFLEEQQLSDWLQGTDYNFGAVYRFDEQPDAANAVIMIADMLGNQTGQPLPRSVESLIESFLAGEPKFNGFYPLHAPDQNEFVEILIVNGQQALDQALPNAAIVAALNQAIDDASLPSDINVALTGEIALAHEEIAAALTGIEIAGIISLVLLAIILGWGIGNYRIIILIFTILSIGIGTTLGFAVLTVGSFNTLSMLFVVMFFGLAVDFAVHFALRLQASQEALERAARNIRCFHSAQRPDPVTVEVEPGVRITRSWVGLERVG